MADHSGDARKVPLSYDEAFDRLAQIFDEAMTAIEQRVRRGSESVAVSMRRRGF